MAEWETRFVGAATWQLARQVQTHIGEREVASGVDADQWVDRCLWLAEHLLALKSLDARAVTGNMLQSLDSAVSQWAGYVATWHSGQGDQYLGGRDDGLRRSAGGSPQLASATQGSSDQSDGGRL